MWGIEDTYTPILDVELSGKIEFERKMLLFSRYIIWFESWVAKIDEWVVGPFVYPLLYVSFI